MKFDVDCDSGDESTSYEVLLTGREGDHNWSVKHVKKFEP